MLNLLKTKISFADCVKKHIKQNGNKNYMQQ